MGALLSFRRSDLGCPSVLQDPGPMQVLDGEEREDWRGAVGASAGG